MMNEDWKASERWQAVRKSSINMNKRLLKQKTEAKVSNRQIKIEAPSVHGCYRAAALR